MTWKLLVSWLLIHFVFVDLTYWQLLLPGYRNSLHKAVSHESNLGYKPCYSRYEKCHEWAKLKHCEIPAFRDFMYYNCYLSCSSCILVIGVPIPGGWSSWSQISSCSTPRCGGGYKVYYRFCNMPPKRFGGKDCPGPRIRKTNCHMTKCDLPKDGCYDEELDCGKRKKYCDHKDYAPYMKFHCKKTCKTCWIFIIFQCVRLLPLNRCWCRFKRDFRAT